MRTIAILPVKSFGAAKQRLGGLLGTGSRRALAQAMFTDVLASLRQVPDIDAITVVTADRTAERVALHERVQVLRDLEESGQSTAVSAGVRHAAAGFDRVLFVAGDTPLLDPAEVGILLRRSAQEDLDVVIVPDRHGTGTNALLLSPPDAIEPGFGPDSRARHARRAADAGLRWASVAVPTLLLDVDTPDDLAELSERLDARRGHAPMTRGTLRQLDRSRVRGSVPARAAV